MARSRERDHGVGSDEPGGVRSSGTQCTHLDGDMSGSQLDFIVDALRTMDERGIATFEVRADAQKSLNTARDAQMNGTVWNSGCGRRYLDDTGRNTTLWPDWTWRYRQLTNHFDPDSYLLTRSSASSTDTRAAEEPFRPRCGHW